MNHVQHLATIVVFVVAMVRCHGAPQEVAQQLSVSNRHHHLFFNQVTVSLYDHAIEDDVLDEQWIVFTEVHSN